MASGYVIAALLEAAGLIGLAIGLVRIQAERRARIAELRSFLRSGQSASSTFDAAGSRRHAGFDDGRVVVVPYAPARGAALPARETAARSALLRAIARGSRPFRPDLVMPLSAGLPLSAG